MARNGITSRGEQNPNFKHGMTDGGNYRHPIYTAWQNMKSRCLNPNNAKYHRYGGRGITIHPDWLVSSNFYAWALANGWSKGLTIDRIENDGNYEPSNCRWISKSKNSQKKSTTKLTFHQAMTIRYAVLGGANEQQIAKKYGVSHGTVWFICHEMTWKDGYE